MSAIFKAIILLLICSNIYAASLEFHKWQFGEFAANLRYVQHGIPTEGINEIYVREVGQFIKAKDITLNVLCPSTTLGTLNGSWTFFGARFIPLIADNEKPSFYSVSYLGGAEAFHNGTSFDALITPGEICASTRANHCELKKKGLSDGFVSRWGHAPLNRTGHHAPLSWNSLDIDGDGKGDFTFGGLLHLSTARYEPIIDRRIGAEAVFIRTDMGVRLVRLHENDISIERFKDGDLQDEKLLPISGVGENAGHALVALPGASNDLIAVRETCGLAAYEYKNNKLSKVKCISGLTDKWAMVGARGDFDSDGIDDFWISQTAHGTPVGLNRDHIRLISGSKWQRLKGNINIDSITIATIRGSTAFSDYDGIGTTLSPVAGDIDGDGIPDLTFSGHRHMNEAGALYVFFGKDYTTGMVTTVEDQRIAKVVGPLMAQLAPPYHHWDATDWDDDGHDDIVVTADNDLRAGLNAGAVYVLSGALIVNGKMTH